MNDHKTALLGLFDGLHRGHMSAVWELLRCDGEKIVYTFDSLSMTTKGARGLLLTDAEKRRMLENLGVDRIISEDFARVRDIEPREFVQNVLCGELRVTKVICGENFRFGKGGAAGADELTSLCRECGIEAIVVPTVYDCGAPISTTRIREHIERGEIEEANRLLGREYSFSGEIAHGFRIGSRMGIKTLNIPFDTVKVLPKKGVYASKVRLSGEELIGITNIGTRPTVHDDGEVVIETHLLDFSGDIYGERAEVRLTAFMREEKRFGSIEELRDTVAGDIEKRRHDVC